MFYFDFYCSCEHFSIVLTSMSVDRVLSIFVMKHKVFFTQTCGRSLLVHINDCLQKYKIENIND